MQLNHSFEVGWVCRNYQIVQSGPGWSGSVDWAPAWALEGRRFASWSGHMPGLQARSPVEGVRGATDQDLAQISLPLCFLPLLSL